jgi:NADPH2:quinone reductase
VSRSGSFAEYALVDERLAGRKPTTLSHEEAAALPLTVRIIVTSMFDDHSLTSNVDGITQSITAWELMVEIFGLAVPADVGQSDVNESKTLLVIGGAGGVGSIAIQMAKQVRVSRPNEQSCVPSNVEGAGVEDRAGGGDGVATRVGRLRQGDGRR